MQTKQQPTVQTATIVEPKPKKKRAGKFDSPAIVKAIVGAKAPLTIEEAAKRSGNEPSGSFKNRLRWLANRDQLIREITEGEGKEQIRKYAKP